ncbi:hypothetical protein SPRG_20817 [Saprolegnia parasitica CBS 223.65]|uniref:IMS import disulfide relay-system CHCH-CHCH-like Cx9C domain-containing protein n=1 Tax=Saprolegnia parasitica (strain CBS 223.65) TaxID=695850 RepID=A0A067C6L1_SAPPC|nr:hypothetical protein SPRG_20817 [Saprolegnia parasitica CBS 223.65]KDO24780.1 hypothetical protein SPRG_20817 [Saprolegnia parasitica CBS 223.65]|eukprot:XP_012204519.1 hypothetical protein SPRG_20817 [Saprolegnia parasitica CBS 223.65]
MTKAFGHMMATCPMDVQAYGACVAKIEGGVNRDACAKEFAKLKLCFEHAVKTAK